MSGSGAADRTEQIFMVTWGVAEEFGGMTAMCLQRARMFRELAGRHAPILTFEPKPGYAGVLAALTEAGHAFAGMEIRNIYHDLRAATLEDRAQVPGAGPLAPRAPEGCPTRVLEDDEGRVFCRVSTVEETGTVVRREYVRPDGSPFLLDETPVDATGEVTRRQLTLLTRDGRVVGVWTRAGDLHRDWVRELAGGRPTALVVDSNFAAGIFARLEEPHIVKFKVLHSSHVVAASDPFTGAIAKPHRVILDNPGQWDGVVFLTEGQRADFTGRFGDADNLLAIPNARERVERLPAFEQRRPATGAMVCSLSRLKNVEAAIRIIHRVSREVPEVHLDVYGGGAEADHLRELADELGVGGHVTLHGFTRHAARAFETATFSMLTSRKEGQPLALMESLGRGCPPVAFDIRYGPRALIRDGDNGFLVAEGDLEAAAADIVRLCRDEGLARSLSAAAWASSAGFGEQAVVDAWREAIADAFARKGDRLRVRAAAFDVSSLAVDGAGTVEIEGELTWQEAGGPPAHEVITATTVVRRRQHGAPVFLPVEVLSRSPRRLSLRLRVTQEEAGRDVAEDVRQLDLVLAITGRNLLRHLRIDFGGGQEHWLPYSTAHGALSVQRRHRRTPAAS